MNVLPLVFLLPYAIDGVGAVLATAHLDRRAACSGIIEGNTRDTDIYDVVNRRGYVILLSSPSYNLVHALLSLHLCYSTVVVCGLCSAPPLTYTHKIGRSLSGRWDPRRSRHACRWQWWKGGKRHPPGALHTSTGAADVEYRLPFSGTLCAYYKIYRNVD